MVKVYDQEITNVVEIYFSHIGAFIQRLSSTDDTVKEGQDSPTTHCHNTFVLPFSTTRDTRSVNLRLIVLASHFSN